jgi:hypothetical protein
MNLYPNILLAVAAVLTIWKGVYVFVPVSTGPDALIGLDSLILQTPRWICLAVVLGVCVARGAFAWPANQAAQYVVVFSVHLLIGLGALWVSMAGLRVVGGVPTWMSRTAALSTIVVPAMQILFAAWFINPVFHRTLDAATRRNVTNAGLIIFAVVVVGFVWAGAMARRAVSQFAMRNRAQFAADEAARQVVKEDAEDSRFRALTPESPMSDWLLFLESAKSEKNRTAAREAIVNRPTYVADLRGMIDSTNMANVKKALWFISETPKPPVEIADAVRGRARFVVSVAEKIDPGAPDSEEILKSKVADVADGVRRASWALFRVGVDLRPELRAMSEACRPREKSNLHEISFECDAMIQFIDQAEQKAAVAK